MSQVRTQLFVLSATHHKHMRSWRGVLVARANKSGSDVQIQSGPGFEFNVETVSFFSCYVRNKKKLTQSENVRYRI